MTSSNRTTAGVHESVASGVEPPNTNETPIAVESDAAAAAPAPAAPADSLDERASSMNARLTGKKRKKITPRSNVWDHFIVTLDLKGDQKAQCNYCKSLYAYSSAKNNGTSSLRAHLKSCKERNKMSTSQTQLVLNQAGDGGMSVWRLDQALGRKKLAKMIIVDELPFKHVQKEGFKEYTAAISPNFRIPSRFTVARDIFKEYENERLLLKERLATTHQRICITTDTWTSNQNLSYMSLTAHYIDRQWRLQRKVLNFCTIVSHTGEAIGKAVEDCLLEWGIDKIFTVTVDNASANDAALDFLKRKIRNWGTGVVDGKWLHMRCIAHIINLVVTNGLRQPEAHKALKKIRCAVKYVKKSPQRLAKFKVCAERARVECKALLCLDVTTRWNSTYLMLAAAEKYEKAFEAYIDDDPCLQNELLEDGCDFLNEEDWAVARRVIVFLEKFFKLTVKISGSTYITSNMFFHEIVEVHDWLAEWGRSEDALFRSMASKMIEKYEKYWGNLNKMNVLIYIGVILNPRWKLKYVERVIGELHQSDKEMGKKICRHVNEALWEMYTWYENKLKKVDTNVGSDVSSQAAQGMDDLDDDVSLNPRQMKYLEENDIEESTSDLEKYLSDVAWTKKKVSPAQLDVLNWWKVNAGLYPILSEMARDVLAVPVSIVASESTFSTGGRVLSDFRSSLNPEMVEYLICTQSWWKKSPSVQDEEDEEGIINLQNGMSRCTINPPPSPAVVIDN